MWETKSVKTSSFVFKLATKYTSCILLICFVISGGHYLFGKSASCILSSGLILQYTDQNYTCSEYESAYSNFYNKWILFGLICQICYFILPLATWYREQNKTIPKCLKKLATSELSEEWINQRTQLIDYIKNNPKKHFEFAVRYLFCEFLVIVLISLFMFSWKAFDFWNVYKSAAASFLFLDIRTFNEEASRLFPKQMNCSYIDENANIFDRYKEAACSFPQNYVNDKIFAVLYIWYIFIFSWSVLHFIILFVEYSFKEIRLCQIRRMFGRTASKCECKNISENGSVGLWFTLRIFRRNMQLIHYQDLCTALLTETAGTSSII